MLGTTFIESDNAAILASLVAASIATLGLIVMIFKENLAERFSPYIASLAAGLLLATAVLLFEEALNAAAYAPYLVIIGYVCLFALNNISDTDNTTGRIFIPLFAIGLHSFVDGIEYGILFNFDIKSAMMASGGLILHEFAEAVVLYVLMRRARLGVFVSFVLSFIGAAATTPLGAVVATSYLEGAQPEYFGMLLSVAIGALLYVGTTHLIDHIKDAQSRSVAMLWYMIGILLTFGLAFFQLSTTAGHDHHITKAYETSLE